MPSYLNLCQHEITVLVPGGPDLILPPSGQIARVSMTRSTTIGPDGVECHVSTPGPVEGLPYPEEGVVLVVSAMVRTHHSLASRDDVASPGPQVRDEKGQPLGCRGLEYNVMPHHHAFEDDPRACVCGSGNPWTTCGGDEISGSAYCG